MKNSFTTDGFQMDLTAVQLSIQEENPLLKEGFSTHFTFPFSLTLTPELKQQLGDYSQIAASDLKRHWEGIFCLEGRAYQAKLEVISVQGNTLQVQIDYGFEELPTMDKKLSELDLGFAEKNLIPNNRYAFPNLIYDKYKGADYFNSFKNQINARTETGNFISNDYSYSGHSNWSEAEQVMKRRNRNLIQPMPYLLYVLRKGFEAMGYTLKGDILQDSLFNRKVIYKPWQHPTYNDQNTYTFEIDPNGETIQSFEMQLSPGEYAFKEIHDTQPFTASVKVKHKVTDTVVWKRILYSGKSTYGFNINRLYQDNTYILEVDKNAYPYASITVQPEKNDYRSNSRPHISYPLLVDIEQWDLRCMVPDITFGELLNTLKDLFSYSVIFTGSEAHLNKIQIDYHQVKEISHTEVLYPTLSYGENTSQLYRFPNVVGYELPNIYLDSEIIQVGEISKSAENEIEVKYCELPYASSTKQIAACQDENVLILADEAIFPLNPARSRYDFHYVTGTHPGDLAEQIQKTRFTFVKNRHVQWQFIDKRAVWQEIKVTDILYVFNQKMLIKEMVKTILDDTYCQIDLTGIVV
ncbi:hypothetical protein ACILFS_01125 [Capnocytophaga canimorsus]|uniref:hypothetical protein n=1 Tax=Capnocytophaga canimorsus TaxID=28188 RepID=UPI0037CF39F1